jgi:hypothetical protein
MFRRFRALGACFALLASLVCAASAFATTSDLIDWNLTETTSTYGTQFHISTGGSLVQFRWLDSPNKSTVVSANTCTDLSLLGSAASIGVGDTGYHSLFSGSSGQCFVLRGRTGAGQGSMVNHDGRVDR